MLIHMNSKYCLNVHRGVPYVFGSVCVCVCVCVWCSYPCICVYVYIMTLCMHVCTCVHSYACAAQDDVSFLL